MDLKKKRHAAYLRCKDTHTHFRCKDTHRLKMKGWKKIFHANGSQKKAGVATLRQNRL